MIFITAQLWVTLTGSLLSALALVTVAVIGALEGKERRQARERAQRRARESRLSMEMMASTSELSDVIAIAIAGGHLNGNVEAARARARAARSAYSEWLMDNAAQDVAKI